MMLSFGTMLNHVYCLYLTGSRRNNVRTYRERSSHLLLARSIKNKAFQTSKYYIK